MDNGLSTALLTVVREGAAVEGDRDTDEAMAGPLLAVTEVAGVDNPAVLLAMDLDGSGRDAVDWPTEVLITVSELTALDCDGADVDECVLESAEDT